MTMMLFGILGLVQVTWLPGFLLLKVTNFKAGKVANLVFGFALSLTFNYLLVLLLTLLRIYTQWVVLVIILLEITTALYLSRKILISNLTNQVRDFWLHGLEIIIGYYKDLQVKLKKKVYVPFFRKLVFGLLFLAALIPLWWVFKIFLDNLGSVFNSWDALVSWNQWATQWAGNAFPQETWRYPQLIPANWSLIYVLIGNSAVQFFTKALMPVFLFSILLLMIALGFERREAGFFLGALITFYVIKHFLGEFIVEGYVDIPVAFMSLAAVSTLIMASGKSQKEAYPLLWLGAVLAGGAAVTKHTGLYTLAVFPILVYLLVIHRYDKQPAKKTIVLLILLVAVSVAIAGPWYIFKEITFLKGLDEPEISIISNVVANAYGDTSLLGRLSGSLSHLGKYLVLYAILLISLFFVETNYRWLVLIMVLPFSILWAVFLGYDVRNLAIAMPFLSLMSGIGLRYVAFWIYRKILLPIVQKLPAVVLVVLIIGIPVVVSVFTRNQKIIDKQVELQKQIFSKSLNASLYEYFSSQDLSGVKVLTNYPIHFLPGFEHSLVNFYFNDMGVLKSQLQDQSIGYLLVPVYATDDIQAYIQTLQEKGEVQFIFDDSAWVGYSFYKIVR